MNWNEQQVLSFIVERIREIPAHNEHGEADLFLLQALEATEKGWIGQVCKGLLEALGESNDGRNVEVKLLELASILVKWSIVLERERSQNPLSLEEGEDVTVLFPGKKLKFFGVILPDRKISIPNLNQIVSMEEVHFFRKKKKAVISAEPSDSLQKAIAGELFKLGIQIK
jgi:hypothetical protein